MELTILSKTPSTIAFQNPPILKSEDNPAATIKTAAFITKVNSPNERKMNGKEKNVSIGLSDTLSTPIITATNIAEPKPLI